MDGGTVSQVYYIYHRSSKKKTNFAGKIKLNKYQQDNIDQESDREATYGPWGLPYNKRKELTYLA